ncbi:MAG: SUMF1/EgtB/PvdO family nonheme iron enzyme [Pseudomonadota bacterium]
MPNLRCTALLACATACLAAGCEKLETVAAAEGVLLGNPYDIQPDGMSLSWVESGLSSFDHYALYRSDEPGVTLDATLVFESGDAAEIWFADTGLAPTETYYYRIWVYNVGGDSAPSNEVSGTTSWDASPSAIELQDPYDITATGMSLAWSRSDAGDFGYYRLFRAEDADVNEAATLVYSTEDQETLAHADTGLVPGTTYFYRVYAEDSWGLATGSNVVSGTTLDTESPTCVLSRAPTARPAGEPFLLEATDCRDNATAVEDLEVRWDFGDGAGWTSPSTDKETSHSYARRGAYTVQLEVSDGTYSSIVSAPLVVTELAELAAGTYTIGRESGSGPWPEQEPARAVSLHAFRVEAHEVTVQDYAAFLTDAGGAAGHYSSQQAITESVDGIYTAHHGHDDHPIAGVTWFDAAAYCAWAGGALPTEAQWEAAARGPSDGPNYQYPWGDALPQSLEPVPANFDDPAGGAVVEVESYEEGVTAWSEDVVLWHMAGNADEWTADLYDEGHYADALAAGDDEDPTGPTESPYEIDFRVTRGGSFANDENPLRVSFRCYADPWQRGTARGVRCAYPTPSASAVAAGGHNSCAVDSYGLLDCWGDDALDQSSPPSGTWDAVSLGASHGCGITRAGAVRCWGDDSAGQVSGAPAGTFTQVSAGTDHSCALRANGAIHCWGADDEGQVSGTPAGTFVQVEVGDWYGCALDATGTISCWGTTREGVTSPPGGTFTTFSAGHLHACALDAAGAVQCWGGNDDGEAGAPAGTFTAVSAGEHHTCAITTEGALTCWGSDYYDQDAAPAGAFTTLAAGAQHTCAIGEDGAVACWGWNFYGQCNAP